MSLIRQFNHLKSTLNKLNNKLNVTSTKLENGKLSKIVNYFKNIYGDYKSVILDTIKDARSHPLQASSYVAGIASFCYLVRTNPTEEQFIEQLLENANDLSIIGDSIRNKSTDEHTQKIIRHLNSGTLKRFTFGAFSVMWVDNFSADVDLYEAHCQYMKVGWLDWKDRIVDYGVLGRWRLLDKSMKDYDVNDDEWKEQQTKK